MPHTDEDTSSYRAFISYSHAADSKLAPTLQAALQGFAKPWYKVRSCKIFRDDTNLSVTPALWLAIEAALATSEFFLLLASPEAAASKWVRKEVAYWLANRSADNLLIIQTGGKIAWDDLRFDFDWLNTNALPVNLAGQFKNEPFYLDLSWANLPDDHLSLRHSEFRKAVLKLAATLFGRDLAELDSEEVRQHRKNLSAAWLAGISLMIVTLLAIVAAFSFLQQKRETERQRDIAFARQLAAESTAQLSENINLALVLSAEALQVKDSPETRSSLLRTLQYSPHLSTFLYGHKDMVRGVAVHPNGHIFASASDDGNIILWDFATRRPRDYLKTNGGAARNISFNPNGDILASSYGDFDDCSLIIWDLKASPPSPSMVVSSKNAISSLTFSSNSKVLGYISDGKAFFWDAKRWQPIGDPVELGIPITALAFHPSRMVLSIGTDDGAVYLLDYPTRRLIGHRLTRNNNSTDKVAFSKDGGLLAAGYHDGTVAVWDLEKQQSLRAESIGESSGLETTGLGFSPDGSVVAVSFTDGSISLLSSTTGKKIGPELRGHRLAAFGVTFSPDGKSLVSGGAEGEIILWDLNAQVPLGRRFGALGKLLETLELDQTGRVIGATQNSGVITLWDALSGRRLGDLLGTEQGEISKFELAPLGHLLAAAYENNDVALWDVETRRTLMPFMKGHKSSIWNFVFSHDSKLLASADQSGAIYLWNTATRHALGAPLFHIKGLLRMAFSDNGKVLASGGEDGSIRLWSLPDGRPIGRPITGHEGAILSIAINPDATIVASGGTAANGSKVYLWDVGTQKALGESLQGHRGPVMALAFSPDGNILASGAADYRIVFWDIATRRPVGLTLTGHEGGIERLLFDPKGKRLISSALDNTVIRWDIDRKSWKERACRIANRNLTCAEWAQFLGDLPYHPTCKGLPFPRTCLSPK
jgi:WD40 repeat protein